MVPFADVLNWLERHGWTLHRIVTPYRVFTKPDALPIVLEVQPGGKVRQADVQRITQILDANEPHVG